MNSDSVVLCPLRQKALADPEAPAVVGESSKISYRELDRRVSRALAGLRERGLAGERVGVYMPRGLDYIVLLWAVIRTGGVACPLSTRLPADAVFPLLEKAGCRALVSSEEELVGRGAISPERLMAGDGGEVGCAELDLDLPTTIVFTSGSTGSPKAAMHTLANHYYSALGSAQNIPLVPGDRWLLSLPLYHVGGLSIVFRCLLAGATIALSKKDAPMGEEIDRLGATHVSMVSTQLLRLLREGAMPEGVKHILLGAGEIPASLLEEAVSRELPVHTSYGLTEMASQVTATIGFSRRELATSGRVLPHRELSISPEGEILVKGKTLFAGYVDGASIEALDGEGWFYTGDLGELDGEERLRVLGRRDNMFVSGGENVQPEEIERALLSLEGVEEAVVVPVPEEEFGQRPLAFVRAEGAISPQKLAESLERLLPRFKIPVAFREWPEEATPGMKPDRELFRRLARNAPP